METIRIKCPSCGAILIVADDPANQGKSVKCPVCKEKHKFSEFKAVKPVLSEEEDKTSLGGGESIADKTVLPDNVRTNDLGFLFDESGQRKYSLSEGLNLIGRMTYQTEPVATVAIETDDRGFSRKHLYIDVVKGADGVIRYYAYNAANKNPTSVNGVQLNEGDKMILHNEDVIKSSETILVFKVSVTLSSEKNNENDATKL